MKKIPLTKGLFALIDDVDYIRVSQYKWYARSSDSTSPIYAARTTTLPNGRKVTVWLHRFILRPSPNRQVDHINHNSLDCRRSNLRQATHSQNQGNRRGCSGTTSKFKGVRWANHVEAWIAQFRHKHLGVFKSEYEAAQAYDLAALKHYGEFAYVNFP